MPNNNTRHASAPNPLKICLRCAECSLILLRPYTCPECFRPLCDDCLAEHLDTDPFKCRNEFRRRNGRKPR
jgi:hypothetical protein